MKKNILIAAAMLASLAASAQSDVLIVTLNDGSQSTYAVTDIKEMTFGTADPAWSALYTGVYNGTQTVTVGGTYTYTADITVTVTSPTEGVLTVEIPQYQLTGTVIGDLTIGAVTITGLEYNSSMGGYYCDYSNSGVTQHISAVRNGQATFDGDYEHGDGSTILLKVDGNKLTIENPFKPGSMPFPMVGNFEGTK